MLGAGPAGIAVIGNLLDHQEESVVWIDTDFSGGSLGKWYENVPSNSLVKTFLDYFHSCESFKFDEFAHQFELSSMDPQGECYLSSVVQPLQWLTTQLRNQINSIQGYCLEVEKFHDQWILTLASGEKIYTTNLVLAIGSHSKTLNLSLPSDCLLIPLEVALDQAKLDTIVDASDSVAVFGTSHSGMLAVKNLCNCDVKQILSFSKNSLRYAVPKDESYIYTNTGLKGAVARWAKEVYENHPPAHLIKLDATQQNVDQFITPQTKVIVAIGFKQNDLPIKGYHKSLCEYDYKTGIIDSHLFGIGIAFPEQIVDLSGDYEWNVGLIKFMKYAKRVIPQWIKNANQAHH